MNIEAGRVRPPPEEDGIGVGRGRAPGIGCPEGSLRFCWLEGGLVCAVRLVDRGAPGAPVAGGEVDRWLVKTAGFNEGVGIITEDRLIGDFGPIGAFSFSVLPLHKSTRSCTELCLPLLLVRFLVVVPRDPEILLCSLTFS